MSTTIVIAFPCWCGWINGGLALLISAVFAALFLPHLSLIAFRKRLFDTCDCRKQHEGIVPQLGGVLFLPTVYFTLILLLGLNLLCHNTRIAADFHLYLQQLAFAFCAGILIYFIGIADDLIGTHYRTKFIVQIGGAILLIASGLYIHDLHGLFGIGVLPRPVAYLLTVMAVVFILNAINLIDGIDGLAAGLGILALGFYGIVLTLYGRYSFATLSFSLLGAILPFFYYNVHGKRGRKIFMGDTGSLSIGLVLAILSIALCNSRPSPSPRQGINLFVLAFSPLIVPCFDVLRVFFHRLRNKRSPFVPDRNHIHHKLLAVGLCKHHALWVILSVSLLFTVVNLLCSPFVNVNILLAADILVWTFANIRLTARIRQTEKTKNIPNAN